VETWRIKVRILDFFGSSLDVGKSGKLRNQGAQTIFCRGAVERPLNDKETCGPSLVRVRGPHAQPSGRRGRNRSPQNRVLRLEFERRIVTLMMFDGNGSFGESRDE
jgi:hypothetical protein